MALTIEQRERRKLGIGSSDMPAIWGCDPYRSAADIWLEKTGKVDPFEGNEHTDRGNWLEPGLMMFAEKTIGHTLERNVTFTDPGGGPLAANLDGLCRELNANVEGKSVSGAIDPDEWGEPWTDQVPERVIIQTHVAMICGRLALSYVPVVLPIYKRFEFKMYVVAFSPIIADAIHVRANAFWRCVQSDTPPERWEPSLEFLKRVRRVPGKVGRVPDDLVERWIVAKANASEAEKEAKAAQAAVLAALDPIDADGATTEGGKVLTYLETSRKGYTVEPTTFRTLRVKGSK